MTNYCPLELTTKEGCKKSKCHLWHINRCGIGKDDEGYCLLKNDMEIFERRQKEREKVKV